MAGLDNLNLLGGATVAPLGKAFSDSNPYASGLQSINQLDPNYQTNGTFDKTKLTKDQQNALDRAGQWEKDNKAGTPTIDPRAYQLLDEQTQQAKDFRNNIPQLADTYMGQIAEVNKKNLASQIDQTQKSYNQRGLLYSTARLGAEQSDKEQSASDLANNRSQLNQKLSTQADTLDQNAIDTGISIANRGQNVANKSTDISGDYLDLALKQQAQNAAALKGLGQAAGSGLGYAGGYLSSTSPSSNTPTPTSAQIGGYQIPNYNSQFYNSTSSPNSGLGLGVKY